jgi:hypothetical protein
VTTPTVERPAVNITLPPLHPVQQEIAKDPTRFKVIDCGRQWGKTLLAITLCFRDATKGKRIWHVAPSYKQTMEGWKYLLRLVNQLPKEFAQIHLSELRVTFAGGGSIQMRTGDEPNNLRGATLDGVVLDEAAYLKPEAWTVLRPTLARSQGWAVFISTPQHYNWFFDLFEMGQDPAFPDWKSWQAPTWTNPYIPGAEIESAQKDMEPDDFDQEYGASFTAVGGAIFPLLSANRPMYLRPMPPGIEVKRTGIGMDWGTTKQHNAAVVCGSMTSSGAVWIRSAWLSDTGDDNAWFDEATRCRRDYKAAFARVDRSQSSARGRLASTGYEAETGVADVEARVGAYQGLIRRQAIFFDLNGPGVREYYTHLCEYHRDPETNKPVEERDDDVDAGGYLLKELTDPKAAIPAKAEFEKRATNTAQRGFKGLN